MKPQTKRIRRGAGILLLLVIGAVLWMGYWLLSPNSSLNRPSAIGSILTWGRLAPFPPSARLSSISTEGSMLTRAFRISFTAPAADIETWLNQSPGTHETPAENPSPGVRYFPITPGGGAGYAGVTVDDTLHLVSIYVYWS